MQRYQSAHERLRAGVERARLLEEWVQADLQKGDKSLQTALGKWVVDVTPRLPGPLPYVARIPWIFVDHLNLAGQRVLLTKGQEVLALGPNETQTSLNPQSSLVKE